MCEPPVIREDDFPQLTEFLRHGNGRARMLGVARRITKSPDLAEDAVQHALVAAFRARASFNPSLGPIDRWLATIVRRAAVSLLEKERPRNEDGAPMVFSSDFEDNGSDTAASATDGDMDLPLLHEDRERLRGLLLRLLLGSDAITMGEIFGDQTTREEMEVRLDLSNDALRQRIHRARAVVWSDISSALPRERVEYLLSGHATMDDWEEATRAVEAYRMAVRPTNTLAKQLATITTYLGGK